MARYPKFKMDFKEINAIVFLIKEADLEEYAVNNI